MLRPIAIRRVFIASVTLLTAAVAAAADNETTLARMRERFRDRQWKQLVDEFADLDVARWPAEQAEAAAEALHLRGQCYGFLQKGQQAEADLKGAVKLSPRNAPMWISLAEHYANNLQDYEQALAAYRQVYALTGKSNGWQPLTATVGMARCLTHQVKTDQALEVLQAYGDLSSLAPSWRIRLLRAYGHVYAARGQEAESLAKFREALELESPSALPAPATQAKTPVQSVPADSDASPLLAGTSKVDITPAPGTAVNLAGQPLSPRDSLYARVLVLKNEHTSLAIVSLDLIVFSSLKVIAAAKQRWGVEHVILSSTHTHAAMAPRGLLIRPPTAPDWTRNGRDPGQTIDWTALSADPWYAATEDKVVAAIGSAMQNLFPARLVVGQGPYVGAYMAHNRRLVRDGRVSPLWENPDRRPTQPVDPTVGVIRVEDHSGKPRAMAVHFACHPVATMTAGVVSRDFPGAMVDHIEQSLGPDCLALYLQGAQGDVDPYDLHNLRGENRFNIPRQAGIALANAALRIVKDRKAPSTNTADIRIQNSLLTIPHRHGNQTSQVGLLTVVINRDLALVAIPGEPFIQHQLDLSAQSPVPNTFILGLAYHGQGSPFVLYIPTAQAAQEGGYGATECSFVAADAGATLVREALAHLQELAKLK